MSGRCGLACRRGWLGGLVDKSGSGQGYCRAGDGGGREDVGRRVEVYLLHLMESECVVGGGLLEGGGVVHEVVAEHFLLVASRPEAGESLGAGAGLLELLLLELHVEVVGGRHEEAA